MRDLFKIPRFTRKELQEIYGLSPRGASIIVQEMENLKFIKPIDGAQQRNVIYEAFEVLEKIKRLNALADKEIQKSFSKKEIVL